VRPSFRFLLVASTIGACNTLTGAEIDLKIIVNATVTASTISSDDVARIFLITKTSLSDGSHVDPVIEREGPTYRAFLKKYIGKTDSALTVYYRRLVFTGKAGMPTTLKSGADVVACVAKCKSAIGFVSADTNTSDVKILVVK